MQPALRNPSTFAKQHSQNNATQTHPERPSNFYLRSAKSLSHTAESRAPNFFYSNLHQTQTLSRNPSPDRPLGTRRESIPHHHQIAARYSPENGSSYPPPKGTARLRPPKRHSPPRSPILPLVAKSNESVLRTAFRENVLKTANSGICLI